MATDQHTPDVATRDAWALDAMIELDRHRGQGYARLRESGTPVWALIQRMGEPTSQNIARVAWEYRLPEVAIHAAIRYYEQHRPSIDAVIKLNDDWFETLGA
jgi:uncharacterized protein (DUF433 family)